MLARCSVCALPARRYLATSANVDDVYDVVVVGAGMVGAALAALLRRNPYTSSMRVAVVDQRSPPTSLDLPLYPDLRVSTITPASIAALKQAGAWEDVAPPRSAAFAHMQVWDAAGAGAIRWSARDIGMQHMGIVVENNLLQAALVRAATRINSMGATGSSFTSATTQAEMLCPEQVASMTFPTYPSSSASSGASASTSTSSSSSSTNARASSGSSAGTSTPSSSSSSSSNQLAELHLEGGRTLWARLVVGADGARSRVREAAGLRTLGWSYDQRGLVASVVLDPSTVTSSSGSSSIGSSSIGSSGGGSGDGSGGGGSSGSSSNGGGSGGMGANDTAWQRFLPTGPLALLPVRGGYSNIVWSTSPAEARALERMDSGSFADAVNAALQDQLPSSHTPAGPASTLLRSLSGIMPSGSSYVAPPRVLGWVGDAPKSFPLQLRHSGRYVRPRLALIGDAAHAVHPLAGQGVNLGIADAVELANALAFAREHGCDIGDLSLLQDRYERPRQAANVAMMGALDSLKRVFGVQAAPIAAMRSAGLGLLNAAAPVKNSIMRYAMGV